MATTIGIIHPGEMGSAFGASLVRGGHKVLWASEGRSADTVARAEKADLTDCGTVAEMITHAAVILSICPPHAAFDVAREIDGFTGLFVDGNAISPASSREVGAIVEKGGASFVDGGIVGNAPDGDKVVPHFYLSGDRASEVAALFNPSEIVPKIVTGNVAGASAVKMSFAAWTKGTSALILDIISLARAEGVEDDLLAEWSETSPELIPRSHGAAQRGGAKGWRWVGEMEEIASSFAAVGLPSGFHEGAAEIFRRCPRESTKQGAEALDQVVTAIVAASNRD